MEKNINRQLLEAKRFDSERDVYGKDWLTDLGHDKDTTRTEFLSNHKGRRT